jgi:hypothetical protein
MADTGKKRLPWTTPQLTTLSASETEGGVPEGYAEGSTYGSFTYGPGPSAS